MKIKATIVKSAILCVLSLGVLSPLPVRAASAANSSGPGPAPAAQSQAGAFSPLVTAVALPGPVVFLKGLSHQNGMERTIGSASRHLYIERDSPGAGVAGRALYRLEATGPGAKPKLLLDAGTGWIGAPISVSYDGRTVYFCMATEKDPFYHLFSIPVAGGEPRQLTFGAFHDCDPEPLPGGGLIFSSTRMGTREEYHSYPTACLMTLSADGQQIRPFTYHIVNDRFPRITSAGDVVCVRQDNFWSDAKIITNIEYLRRNGEGGFVLMGQERGGCEYDPGTDTEGHPRGLGLLAGAGLPYKRTGFMYGCPAALPEGRTASLRGMCIGEAYRMVPAPSRDFVTNIVIALASGSAPDGETVKPSIPVHDIAPLPDGRLLCTTLDRKGLGVVNLPSGQVTLFYRDDRVHGAVCATPRPEPMPWDLKRLPDDDPAATGYLFCHSVFNTSETKADLRRIRGVRIYEGKPFAMTGASYIGPTGNTGSGPHIGTEAVELGTVPVNRGGGFFVEVPADRALAFQAVDAEGRAIVSSMSWIYIRPGERKSCVGCHAPRTAAPSPGGIAGQKPPLKMRDEAGALRWKAISFKHTDGNGLLGFQAERIRESRSVNLYPWPDVMGAADATPLLPGRAATIRALAEQAQAGPAPRRIAALRRLAVLHERSITPSLVSALQADDARIRLEAAQALAACGDQSAPAALVTQLEKEGDPYATLAIEQALNHLTGGDCRGGPAWRQWLAQNSGDQITRALAGKLGKTNDHQDIIMAVQALGHLGGATACAALRGVAATNSPLNARVEAMTALARLKDHEALPILAKILTENNRGERSSALNILLFSAAAQALGLYGGAEAEKALVEAMPRLALFGKYNRSLGDQIAWADFNSYGWPYFRVLEAFDTLGTRLGKTDVLRLIGSLHHSFDQATLFELDSYETMLVRVVQRSGHLETLRRSVVAILRGEDQMADPEVREHFAHSGQIFYLVFSLPAVAKPPIAEHFMAGWRSAYVLSLLSIRPEHASDLVDLYRRYHAKIPAPPASRRGQWVKDYVYQPLPMSLYSGVQLYCLEALGRLRAPEAYDLCVEALTRDPPDAAYGIGPVFQSEIFLSPAPRYRAAAAYALGQLGRQDAVPVLMRAVQDFENVGDVRHWAARALGELCGREQAGPLRTLAANYPEVHNRRTLMEAAARAEARESK